MTAQLTQPAISDIIQAQRNFFRTGQTQSLDFRIEQLDKLQRYILEYQDEVLAAVKADLNRPAFEGYFEIAAIAEIKHALKNLRAWAKPQKVKTTIDQFPASAYIQPEPLGVALIIAPWNYPFQLTMMPLVGAIAAGNCAILKPSELAPNTAAVINKIITTAFSPEYVAVVEGAVETSQQLLAEKFDHIFFTGGTAIGRIVMAAAAKHLTPVTLELGGKSPCIVDADVNLETAAKRIVWGKFINAGQTCIAPDYLLVDRTIKEPLLEKIKQYIQEFYGDDPAQSESYCRIISDRHFERLAGFLSSGTVAIGGQTDAAQKFIAPTVLDNVDWDDAVMQDEIFGPILPILVYDKLEDAINVVNDRPKPLALYFFSNDTAKQDQVLAQTSSGGACINDTVMQVGVSALPFGGVGESGMGAYHGKASFDTFSHQKSVLRKGLWFDLAWRYAPYTVKQLKQIKGIVNG
ncbi:aldehyde dehydrogenase [filamentous cyanobacterium LEGE 11480]|uniref:Aldehyde dehydrogenase n=1 Tax=Romeriopsis navalis LEGE 11480 TaxID=2777977 RepID=A0A928VP66_9CYAN|nr:aldehyde dehydrogenase [Romeriopsis navalis]MBE9031920.1 aldehyde dehydrogenase [Romeriopsis navalis LEGE 11480]